MIPRRPPLSASPLPTASTADVRPSSGNPTGVNMVSNSALAQMHLTQERSLPQPSTVTGSAATSGRKHPFIHARPLASKTDLVNQDGSNSINQEENITKQTTLSTSKPQTSALQKKLIAQMPSKNHPKGTDELYGIGPLPAARAERIKYLSDPNHWKPERRELHNTLIANATTKALNFAEAMRENGMEPAIYALRGNTAVGKTRMATSENPALSNALERSGGGAVNPDVFKTLLRSSNEGEEKLDSTQVHVESVVLTNRLIDELRSLKTTDGDPASFLLDKRLGDTSEVEHYASMARDTERNFVLWDIDANLEKSLIGVLERHPDGPDPLPPYHIISKGFSDIRTNRSAIIDRFIANPDRGPYQLYGTIPNGEKVKVASVEKGELTIEDPDMYAELTTAPGDISVGVSEKLIDEPLIDTLTKDLDLERANSVRSALTKYIGMTWIQALDTHCD